MANVPSAPRPSSPAPPHASVGLDPRAFDAAPAPPAHAHDHPDVAPIPWATGRVGVETAIDAVTRELVPAAPAPAPAKSTPAKAMPRKP